MRTIVLNNSTESNLMKLWEMFERDVEELQRRDDELNREMEQSIKRCQKLLEKLKQLDE
jgi:prefoldin subunit 5